MVSNLAKRNKKKKNLEYKDFINVKLYAAFMRENLNYEFNDMSLLFEALTHSSFANEHKSKNIKDNERLEFLGDAVLEAVISEALYLDGIGWDEGQMTKIRSLTVREESLVAAANEISLSDYLILGQGEEKTGGRDKASNSEDAYEAMVGAIFVDGSYQDAKDFIAMTLESTYEKAKSGQLIYDYKSKVYQILQEKENLPEVEFKLIREKGPAHNKTFTVALIYKGKQYPEASASSKKQAEQLASKNFLKAYLRPEEG